MTPPTDAPVRDPAPATPPRPRYGLRRTAHVAAGPVGGDYAGGAQRERRLLAACRDVGPLGPLGTRGDTGVLGAAAVRALASTDARLRVDDVDGAVPDALAGWHPVRGWRRTVGGVTGLDARQRDALLLLTVGANLSGYARMQAARAAGATQAELIPPAARQLLADSCAGWAADGEILRELRAGTSRPPRLPPPVPAPDGDGWHDLGELAPGWVRRRRRIDVERTGAGIRVDATFRDSWVDPDGAERSLHEWELALLAADGQVVSAAAVPRSLPFGACPAAARHLDRLKGTGLADLRATVRARLGSVAGCTHLNDLLSAIPDAVAAALPFLPDPS